MPKAHQPNGVCKRDSARKGYTPVNDTEWDDMREFLEVTFLPAPRKSIGGNNVTATCARLYVTNQKIWRTTVELTSWRLRALALRSGRWPSVGLPAQCRMPHAACAARHVLLLLMLMPASAPPDGRLNRKSEQSHMAHGICHMAWMREDGGVDSGCGRARTARCEVLLATKN
jgi:hypothetical protein